MSLEAYIHSKLQSPLRLEWGVKQVLRAVLEALKSYEGVKVDLYRVMVRLGLDYLEAKAVIHEAANRLEEMGYIVKWLQPEVRYEVLDLEGGKENE